MIQSDVAHRIIMEIANASGHSKHSILSMNPSLSKYLLAAYDPYTRYYVTKCAKGIGIEQFSELTWEILDRLSDRKVSGHDAQILIRMHTEEMTPRSAELFGMILKKDMRMGMGAKSINKVLPGLIPTHDVMLAKLFEFNRIKYPCFGSPKIDGVRGKFKNGMFYSRGGHPYKGLDHLKFELQNMTTEIDGELTVLGCGFQEASGLIRNDYPTPNAVFNILELPELKIPYRERLLAIRDLHLVGPHIVQVPRQRLTSEKEVFDYYDVCRNNGYEGAVITPWDYAYKGTRSYDWMKMKPNKTVDLKVTNFYGGKGKYKGQLGGVCVMFNGQENRVGGGFSDWQRKMFYDAPKMIIGKMIEVEYMEETDDGNLRHSRFKGFRLDLEA